MTLFLFFSGEEEAPESTTRWTSDWASPSLTLFLLPTFAHAGWSILVTLYVNGCVASRGADALSTRAVTALGRVAGLACVACSIWAAHAIWTRGMKTAQRDVAIPLTLSSPPCCMREKET